MSPHTRCGCTDCEIRLRQKWAFERAQARARAAVVAEAERIAREAAEEAS